MKTKAKFVVLMVLIVILNNHYTHAQWNFNGDAVGSVTSIGPTTNYDFPFITNNTEKLRIKTTGEVGIGTTTPSSWLHVENTSEDEMFRTNGATGSLWRMLTGGTARFNIFHSINGTDHNIQMESTLGELRLATTTSQPMLFYTNNVERIRIPGSGFVGMGEIFPRSNLHIHRPRGSPSHEVFTQWTNATTGSGSQTEGLRVGITSANIAELRQEENAAMIFYTGVSGGSATERMRILNGGTSNEGRVGINTTTPVAQLDVNGVQSTASLGIRAETGSSTSTGQARGLQVYTDDGSSTWGISSVVTNDTGSNADLYALYALVGDMGAGTQINHGSCLVMENIYNMPGSGGTTGLKTGASASLSGQAREMRGFYAEVYGNNTGNAYGFQSIMQKNPSSGTLTNSYGAHNLVSGGSNENVGVLGSGTGGDKAYGGQFSAAGGSSINYGVYGAASGGSTVNFGVYATVASPSCAQGGPCSDAAIYAAGDGYSTGSWFTSSDANIKKNILLISDYWTILDGLNGYRYDFDTTLNSTTNLNLSVGPQMGLIAQELEVVAPELVKSFINPGSTDSLGVVKNNISVKSINYDGLMPVLVEAIKDLKAQVDSLISNSASQRLMNDGSTLENQNTKSEVGNKQKIVLSNQQGIILNQNDPNPFTESTRITFQIPDEVKNAKIIFTSTSGTIINTAIINERGVGELEVYSSELSKGLYNYTLVCDGQVIATKKMVKQ